MKRLHARLQSNLDGPSLAHAIQVPMSPLLKSESWKRSNNRGFTSVQNFHTQTHPCANVFSCWVPDGPIWNCQLVTRQSHCGRYPAFDQSVFLCQTKSFLLVYPDANFMPKKYVLWQCKIPNLLPLNLCRLLRMSVSLFSNLVSPKKT